MLALIAGVGTFFLVRSQRANGVSHPTAVRVPDAGPASGVSHPTAAHDAAPAAADRGERPQLPPQGGAYTFAAEARDGVWADEQERELTLRVRKIVGDLQKTGKTVDVTGVECRRSLCKLTLHAPDSATLGGLYGKLEEPSGLLGWADHILLEAVVVGDDGRVKTDVLAVFERDPTP